MKKASRKSTAVVKKTTASSVAVAGQLLTDIRRLIESTKIRFAQAANAGLVMLYWNIGNRIRTDVLGQERAEYGKQIVDTLSEHLTLEYGRGFTRSNLFNMLRFVEVFPDNSIVHALSGQLSWKATGSSLAL